MKYFNAFLMSRTLRHFPAARSPPSSFGVHALRIFVTSDGFPIVPRIDCSISDRMRTRTSLLRRSPAGADEEDTSNLSGE
jgi:hypothetical protein